MDMIIISKIRVKNACVICHATYSRKIHIGHLFKYDVCKEGVILKSK